MVYGLGLKTSPRLDAIPLPKKSSIASSPFEELLKSSRKSEEHHNSIHHVHRRPHVEPYSISQHHHRQRHHAHAPRSPSEPPTSSSNESSDEHRRSPVQHHRALPRTFQGRPRSNSEPSSSNTHLTSPFAHHKPLPSTEHYAGRIKELRDGDGEWEPWSLNVVSPTVLPYHARPHLNTQASTSALPADFMRCSPLHHPPSECEQAQAQTQPPTLAYFPIQLPRPAIHHRTSSLSSPYTCHSSPLSQGFPSTPKGTQIVNEDVEFRSSTPTPASTGARLQRKVRD
ncbi:hypothetical protein CNBB0640 [Cryptococcus deneoformans B-3501A]|uniref:Uncharacterized protein n=1 Tax=Cryptococcus deneoformans (strain JEC21 / ATCC MYA-565) TaxID=214684 RepID=Q5KLI9_CRYD1|nr:hypothetical protein CNB05100 [Cryptococcus neoformans var. neoformans JEC21]XP_777490.1 hypothetical protein CNBB0640 [Cryptococcus neoformans var. neoformans B-3501A]AAW41734.1 hypothetical protein CNB05100 [Cryptococcus neoformans var. neoformans JEC21]EAL22843.1 hypothetical protein CNBB0640 [Cryptococcus neoformans var. neoformans B-3501A]